MINEQTVAGMHGNGEDAPKAAFSFRLGISDSGGELPGLVVA